MVDRIKQLLEKKKMTPTQFSDEIDVQRSSLSHVLSGRNKPSLDFMLKIKNRFPEISLDWLLLGEGSMIADNKSELNKKIPGNELQAELTFNKDKAETGDNTTVSSQRNQPETEIKATDISSSVRKPVKMIMVYDDNSFETFEPRQ